MQSMINSEDCCLSLKNVNYPIVPCGFPMAPLGTLAHTLGTTGLGNAKQHVVFRCFDSSHCLSVYNKCRLRKNFRTIVSHLMMFLLIRARILSLLFIFSSDLIFI